MPGRSLGEMGAFVALLEHRDILFDTGAVISAMPCLSRGRNPIRLIRSFPPAKHTFPGRPTDRREPFLKQRERGLDEWDGRGLRSRLAGSSRQTACYSLLTGERAALRAGLRHKTHVISLAYPKRTFARRKK
jgi:hypothetical protein